MKRKYTQEFSSRLRQARLNRGVSREIIANDLDIHKNTFGNYERGERLPEAFLIAQFCSLLNVNPSWLITGQGPMHLPDNPAGVDSGLLTQILDALDEYLEGTRVILTNRQKAEIVSALYEDASTRERDSYQLSASTRTLIAILAGSRQEEEDQG